MITLKDLYAIEDPAELFRLTSEAITQRQEDVDKLAAIRAGAIAALYAQGFSYKDLAQTLGVSAPRIGQLVSSNDAAAVEVLRAWVAVERQLAEIAEISGNGSHGSTYDVAVRALQESGRFNQQALVDLDSIRHVRNHLVHGRMAVTEEAAEDVLDKAMHLSALLTLWLHDARRSRPPFTAIEVSDEKAGRSLLGTVEHAQRKIVQLRADEVGLRKRLSDALAAASKARTESATKRQQASKTRSGAMTSTYLRAAEAADRKSATENKKAADITRKLADIAKKQFAATQELERLTKAAERRQAVVDTRKRPTQKQHAQGIARLSRPSVRHVHRVRVIEPPKPEKLRVLYLTSNPDAENYLRVDVEVREVRQAVRKATHRDLVEMDHRPAATPEDLLDGINEIRPHVVHFSGHGGGSSLLFSDAKNEGSSGRAMSFDLLGRALAATDYTPKLVVLNACETVTDADTLLNVVPAVVAMSAAISDLAATAFAARFYSAIASAQSLQAALDQGAVAVDLLELKEGWKPNLITRLGLDVQSLTLVQPLPA